MFFLVLSPCFSLSSNFCYLITFIQFIRFKSDSIKPTLQQSVKQFTTGHHNTFRYGVYGYSQYQ